jgi:mannosyltransferase
MMATRGLDAMGGQAPGRSRARAPGLARTLDLELALVAGLTLLALAVRLPHLGESLVGDEMYAYAEVHRRSLGGVIDAVRGGGENSPPLFFVLAWATMKLGDPTVLIRLPSLLLGTATVPLVYLIGVRTVGARAGVLAAALLALSPFAIFYSTEARPYATLTFFVALSTLAFLRAIETNRRGWWIAYAVTGCLVLYAHYFGLFVLAAHAGWALWAHHDRWRALLLADIALGIGYVPWLIAFLGQKGNSISILAFYAPLNTRGVERELLRLFPGHPSFLASELPGRGVLTALALALAVATVAGAGASLRRTGRLPRPAPGLVLVAALAVAPIAGFLAYSALGPELFIARYLSAALPFVVLVAGAALAWPSRAPSLLVSAVAIAGVAVGAIAGLEDEHRRPDYKAAAHYIDRHARPDDPVVQADLTLGATRSQVMSKGRQQSLDVNFERDHRVLSIFQEGDSVEAYTAAARSPRFLLVGPAPLPPPPASLGARATASGSFPGSLPLTVRVYSPADPSAGFNLAGLAGARRAAARLRRKARRFAGCLRRAGLAPRHAETSPRGSIALEAPLAGGGRSLLFVYPTPEAASQALAGIAGFLKAAGGQAKLESDIVVGYTSRPERSVRARVESCL